MEIFFTFIKAKITTHQFNVFTVLTYLHLYRKVYKLCAQRINKLRQFKCTFWYILYFGNTHRTINVFYLHKVMYITKLIHFHDMKIGKKVTIHNLLSRFLPIKFF